MTVALKLRADGPIAPEFIVETSGYWRVNIVGCLLATADTEFSFHCVRSFQARFTIPTVFRPISIMLFLKLLSIMATKDNKAIDKPIEMKPFVIIPVMGGRVHITWIPVTHHYVG